VVLVIDMGEPPKDHRRESGLMRMTEVWDDTHHILLFINRLLISVKPGARILDFGCGSGQTVYKLREMGFEAYGFDIHDYVQYRSDEDRAWFRFSPATTTKNSVFTIDPDTYSIPFDDDCFDVVHSSSVLEHVLDARPMFRECARVLRRDGVAVHFYPGKLQLVEPHIYVPFASFIQCKAWLRLWVWLGVRNEFQEGRTPSQVTDAFKEYTMTGLRYRTTNELRTAASEYFDYVQFPPRHVTWPRDSRWAQLREVGRAFAGTDVFKKLALCGRLSSLVCEKKKRYKLTRRPGLWKDGLV
jgi:SAM-dependent methyltransferase